MNNRKSLLLTSLVLGLGLFFTAFANAQVLTNGVQNNEREYQPFRLPLPTPTPVVKPFLNVCLNECGRSNYIPGDTCTLDCMADKRCARDRCQSKGVCVNDEGTGDFLGCQCDEGRMGNACGRCLPKFSGPDCDVCQTGYTDGPNGPCSECEPGFRAEHRLPTGGEFHDQPLPWETSLSAVDSLDVTCVKEETSCAASCGPNGACTVLDGVARCTCDPGYTGMRCDECSNNYELIAGTCQLGPKCAEEFCNGNGQCIIGPGDLYGFGDFIDCDCDPGFEAGACTPDLQADVPQESIAQGETITLNVTSGQTGVTWDIIEGPGALTNATGTSVDYTANFASDEWEMAKVQITSGSDSSTVVIDVHPDLCVPSRGFARPELKAFDQAMCEYMRARGIRAGLIGIAKDGQPLYFRGHGFVDKGADGDPFIHYGEEATRLKSTTHMRYGGVTRAFTAAGVKKIVADRATPPSFQLATAAMDSSLTYDPFEPFPYTSDGDPIIEQTDVTPEYQCAQFPDSLPDHRWFNIYYDDLIYHRAGFDQFLNPLNGWPTFGSDPDQLRQYTSNESLGAPGFNLLHKSVEMTWDYEKRYNFPGTPFCNLFEATCYWGPPLARDIVRHRAGYCLAHDPGTKKVPSDFGYLMLGRVLEGLKGQLWVPDNSGYGPYIDLVREMLDENGIAWGTIDNARMRPNTGNPIFSPYYRDLNADGSEILVFDYYPDIAYYDVDFIPEPILLLGPNEFTPRPYGGMYFPSMDSVNSLRGSPTSPTKLMARHWIGGPLIGQYTDGKRRANAGLMNGKMPGTYSMLWQIGTSRSCFDEKIGQGCITDTQCKSGGPSANICVNGFCERSSCDFPSDCAGTHAPYCVDGMCTACTQGCFGELTDPNAQCAVEYVVPEERGEWSQFDSSTAKPIRADRGKCALPESLDIYLNFNQMQDPKDPDSTEYNRVKDFIIRAACQVEEWPPSAPFCKNGTPC